MDKQPEALRLAADLHLASTRCDHHYSLDRSAASELERQHALIAELVEALEFYAKMMGRRRSNNEPFYMNALDLDCGDRARVALSKAKESP